MKIAQCIAVLAMAAASLATPTPAKREASVDIESYPCEFHALETYLYWLRYMILS